MKLVGPLDVGRSTHVVLPSMFDYLLIKCALAASQQWGRGFNNICVHIICDLRFLCLPLFCVCVSCETLKHCPIVLAQHSQHSSSARQWISGSRLIVRVFFCLLAQLLPANTPDLSGDQEVWNAIFCIVIYIFVQVTRCDAAVGKATRRLTKFAFFQPESRKRKKKKNMQMHR